jgi:hypothetical protein
MTLDELRLRDQVVFRATRRYCKKTSTLVLWLDAAAKGRAGTSN